MRLEAARMWVGISFDANDRQDDDRCRFICRTAEAHDAPFVRKFDDGAHQPLSSAAGKERNAPMREIGIRAIKRQARLTVCKQRATGPRQHRKRTDRTRPA
jgi:hypothetical protein